MRRLASRVVAAADAATAPITRRKHTRHIDPPPLLLVGRTRTTGGTGLRMRARRGGPRHGRTRLLPHALYPSF
ncbi:hypothetical protein E2C01_094662 [Portunus trituberculatus]|uniref:Uncharacterized protein n=1 Tax=Portunus trituberculatus TaxID=210409 RepID=A0A5B7K299_PORTR|nr:hypothetical protein [Portunus trituberculatus]